MKCDVLYSSLKIASLDVKIFYLLPILEFSHSYLYLNIFGAS